MQRRSRPPCPLGELEAAALSEGTPPQYEALWVNDLLREMPWRTVASRPVGSEHINVRELRAALRHAFQEARGRRGLRVLSVLDSRVSIGALGKGRSASAQLNAELPAALPEILAQDLYPGFLLRPTRLNLADAPSRLRADAAPALAPSIPGKSEPPRPPGGLPGWARDILGGEFASLDALLRVPMQSRMTMGWACLTLRLAAARGRPLAPKELPFDGTLGYPGEGLRPHAGGRRAAVGPHPGVLCMGVA